MKKVKILDRSFGHSKYTTPFQESKYFLWDRDLKINQDDLAIYTDFYLRRSLGNYIELMLRNNIKESRSSFVKMLLSKTYKRLYGSSWNRDIENKNKFGMLIEPRAIIPTTYEFIKKYGEKFNKVLTYDRELLELGKNFVFYPHGGCWIKPEEQKIHEKTKLLSTIASRKKNTEGHKLRHKIIKTYKENIDVYGFAYHPIPNKIFALKDYMFSLTIENSRLDYYFTEKLIDCFMTGAIPIYWGCPSIGNFFDTRGMLIMKDIDDFNGLLDILTTDLYNSKIEFARNNLEIAKKYLIAEDWIYENLKIL